MTRDIDTPETSEDRAALRAIDSLSVGAARTSEEVAIEREFVELLGLLPYELDPETPSPRAREGLLLSVSGESQARVVPFASEADRSPASEPRRGALTLLAAALAAVAITLAGWGGWLLSRLGDERATVARLEERLERTSMSEDELAAAKAELARLENRLSLLTTPGIEVCALRPRGDQPEARGILYVSADRGRWVLAADQLEVCPEGRRYVLWFLTESEAIRGGSFEVVAGQRIEVAADGVPPETRAVMVTLEAEEEPPAPEGPTVLYGDEPHLLL